MKITREGITHKTKVTKIREGLVEKINYITEWRAMAPLLLIPVLGVLVWWVFSHLAQLGFHQCPICGAWR